MSLLSGQWIADIFKQEVPTGTVNGVNTDFTLSALPHSDDGTLVFINSIPQVLGTDFTISTQTISFTTAPVTGQQVYVFYVKGEL
jgi:hypothetical protein